MSTMRESFVTWVGNNYSLCKDNSICDKMPIDTRLTMIETAGMSGIPQWPEEEDLVNPVYTEFGAPIKEDLTLGQLVKGTARDVIVPRTKDTVGIFHTHTGAYPLLGFTDVIDALIHDDKVTCIGAGGITATRVKCYTRKEPQWSEWRARALKMQDNERELAKALSETFRDEKTGKPLGWRKLHRVLTGAEPVIYRTTDADVGPTVKRIIEVSDRLNELRGHELGPRLGDVELGLIAEQRWLAPIQTELHALTYKRGRLQEQKRAGIGDVDSIQRTLSDLDQRILELQEEYAELEKPLIQLLEEDQALREETGVLYERLDNIRAEREKDKPDIRKYRKWRDDVDRETYEFHSAVENIVSRTKGGYYIEHGYKYPSLIEDCTVYEEVFGKYKEEPDEPQVPAWIDRYREFFKK